MKRKWNQPKLIVLTRGRPEEAVLGTCKAINENSVGTGPAHDFDKCFVHNEDRPCKTSACQGQSDS
jgi:hypothetical protein